MSRRSSYPPLYLWRDSAAGKRARRTWTDLPGKPARYLHARRRGLRRFAGVIIALVAALCVLAVVG